MVLDDRPKCERSARAFAKKLQSDYNPDKIREGALMDAPPWPPFDEDIRCAHIPVTRIEVIKAISEMSSRKAPGPDKYTPDKYTPDKYTPDKYFRV